MKNLAVYYDMVVKRGGKVVRKYRKRPCHSFVKQFIQFLYLYNTLDSAVTIKDTGGTNRTGTISGTNHLWSPTTTVGDATLGPVVGTGTTTVAITDYAMETLIAHGTGSGQLQYSVHTYGSVSSTAAGTSAVLTRVFTNGSGSDITVNEIGVITKHAGTTLKFLILHDNLGVSAVTLANGESLTLNYTFATTI